MTFAAVPVFRKDVRALLRLLPSFLVLQLLTVVGAALLFWVKGWPGLRSVTSEVAVATQWLFGHAYALVAAAYFLAEERNAGTEIFLRRLPVSRARINAEKIGAGLTVVALLWACFVATHLLALPMGGLWSTEMLASGILGESQPDGLWKTTAFVGGMLATVYVSSYLVGLLVSLAVRQVIVVVLVGFAIWWAVFVFLMVLDSELPVTRDMVWLNLLVYAPLVAAPLVMALPGRRFRFFPATTWSFVGRWRLAGLVWKSITANSLLQALCLVFLVTALFLRGDVDAWMVTAVGVILLAALGTAAYAPLEKEGLHCVLYQHPVPRLHLFWAQTIAAVAPVLAVSAATFLLWNRQWSVPFLLVLALGCFAYACAVLLTLAFPKQLTAMLATIAVVFTTFIWPIVILEFLSPNVIPQFAFITTDTIFGSGNAGFIALQATALPVTLLAVGCFWAARRMATDRAVLTGSPRYRLTRFAGLYSVVFIVSALVTVAGWGNLISFLEAR